MLISEIINKIRYEAENDLIDKCAKAGMDTTLATIVSELVYIDLQRMANELMNKRIFTLQGEIDKAKKEPDNGTVASESDDCKNGGTKSDKNS